MTKPSNSPELPKFKDVEISAAIYDLAEIFSCADGGEALIGLCVAMKELEDRGGDKMRPFLEEFKRISSTLKKLSVCGMK